MPVLRSHGRGRDGSVAGARKSPPPSLYTAAPKLDTRDEPIGGERGATLLVRLQAAAAARLPGAGQLLSLREDPPGRSAPPAPRRFLPSRRPLGRSRRPARPPAMAAPGSRSLTEVRRRVAEVHRREPDPERQLRIYDGWAPEYEQLRAQGFCHFHGLDGSRGMLELAHRTGLYQDLKQCTLGQEVLPAPTGCYDAVLIVGALSEGQVPTAVVPELLRVTKPGGYLCLTTRSNRGNLPYKAQLERLLADLEQQGLGEKVLVQEVEQWEKSTSEQEALPGSDSDYISGVVYLYRKSRLGPG